MSHSHDLPLGGKPSASSASQAAQPPASSPVLHDLFFMRRDEIEDTPLLELLLSALCPTGEKPARGALYRVREDLRTLADLAMFASDSASEIVTLPELGRMLDTLSNRLDVGLELLRREQYEATRAPAVETSVQTAVQAAPSAT